MVSFMRTRMVDETWRHEVATKDYAQVAGIMNEDVVLDGWRRALTASFTPLCEEKSGIAS